MLKLVSKIEQSNKVEHSDADFHLTLAYEQRQKARFKAQLDEGGEAGLFLERGQVLHHGDMLQSDSGQLVRIVAAQEAVSEVSCSDPLLLARLCYHLGNRHVPLQIGENFVRYQRDHVLDHLVEHFDLAVRHCSARFEPESGAYHSHSHSHSHSHDH